MANDDIKKTYSKKGQKYPACFPYRLSTKNCHTDLKNMLKMFYQRNEDRIRKRFVLYNPTYSGAHKMCFKLEYAN